MTKYSINDLTFHEDSQQEQIRTRKVFEDLKAKAISGSKLTAHERNFFCQGVKVSALNDGSIEGYPCCDDFKFNFLYLIYFRDLTGGSKYEKIGKNGSRYQINSSEVQNDLKYLIEKAEEWDLVVQKNHSDQLLLQICIEARSELKTLDNLPEIQNDPYSKGRFYYRYKRWAILLHFKWLYLIGSEILEVHHEKGLNLAINNANIEFTEYSIVHILNRHYSKDAKQFETAKSFHIPDFHPRNLTQQLMEILKTIDETKLLSTKSIERIAFRFKEKDYSLWTADKVKSIKGQGEVNYKRVQTFYPIEDEKELAILTANYVMNNLGNDLCVYVEK